MSVDQDFRANFTGSMRDYVYLDHNATTPISQRIIEKMPELLTAWGNPSSIHQAGRGPKALVRDARKKIAELLGVSSLEVVFTSGGTESNNLVFNNAYESFKDKHWIVSNVEHPSIMQSIEYYKNSGVDISLLPVCRKGQVDLEQYKSLFKENTAFVSCMLSNNETGNILPIKKMAKIAHQNGALIHSDCVQALGKMLFDLKSLDVDFATVSAHKFYALKGCSVLYVKSGVSLETFVKGGGQERGRRGGTENLLSIVAFGIMAEEKNNIADYCAKTEILRDLMEEEILKLIPKVEITGREHKRVANTSNMIIDGIDGETLLMNLDMAGFAVSTGAACSSGSPEPSPVLINMGLTREEAQSSMRISLGWASTKEEVINFVNELTQVVKRVREL